MQCALCQNSQTISLITLAYHPLCYQCFSHLHFDIKKDKFANLTLITLYKKNLFIMNLLYEYEIQIKMHYQRFFYDHLIYFCYENFKNKQIVLLALPITKKNEQKYGFNSHYHLFKTCNHQIYDDFWQNECEISKEKQFFPKKQFNYTNYKKKKVIIVATVVINKTILINFTNFLKTQYKIYVDHVVILIKD